jgi:hypothetical protein
VSKAVGNRLSRKETDRDRETNKPQSETKDAEKRDIALELLLVSELSQTALKENRRSEEA